MKMIAGLLVMVVGLLGLFVPPSGRPPIGPLSRYEPRLYDFSFAVTLSTLQQPIATDRRDYDLTDAPIVLPIIHLSTFSKIDGDSIGAKLWLNGREENPRLQIKPGFPYNTHLATLTVPRFEGQSLRWQVSYRVQTWSSWIDDAAAAKIPWPGPPGSTEWPKEVQDGTQPQKYIESDDPIFAQTVQRVSEGKLRLVPPYLAAKDLVRYAINQIQTSGDGVDRGEFGVIRGLEVFGAKQAATKRIGTPHDLVCVCVAMLRAAGIPARPVIGVQENAKGRNEFVSWAEFYLPDAGWIPFDPYIMRGKGIRTMDVKKPWPEFGTMKELNERVPLAYHFIPAATVESPRNPALWGWDPRPYGDPGSTPQISLGLISRGKGVEDPK
jgi:hypothetical protein